MERVTIDDVRRARELLATELEPTPLGRYPSLDQRLDATVYVKHENVLPTKAFKVRGGLTLLSSMDAAERSRGVITASTGNHGQSIAFAARRFGARAVVVAPEGANPLKVGAMKALGAEIVLYGKDFDEAREHCEQLATETGMRYVSSGDEIALIAGVGTYSLELLEQAPELEMIFVPVGGGSGAAGTCVVVKSLAPAVKVIGVQAAAAPAAYLTWKRRAATEAKMQTAAEGLATRAPFMLPQAILWQHLDDFLLVEEAAMVEAVRIYYEETGHAIEHAGAASLAGALSMGRGLRGKHIALIASGGNITQEQLDGCLEAL